MRIILFALLFSLSACTQVYDLGVGARTATEKLRADLGAGLDLKNALLKDLANKNAQLEYVSYSQYPCGPNTPEFIRMRGYDRNPASASIRAKALQEAKQAKIKSFQEMYDPLRLILSYGKTLSDMLSGIDEAKKSAAELKNIVDNYKGFVPGTAAVGLKAFRDLVSLAEYGFVAGMEGALIAVAYDAQPTLEAAKDSIVNSKILKALSADEAAAFYAWDSCALDRLYFLRGFDPDNPTAFNPNKKFYGATAGETRSQVIDFALLYKTYLDEREAFIGQRPDYLATIEGIIDANAKLANPAIASKPSEILGLLAKIGESAQEGRARYQAVAAN